MEKSASFYYRGDKGLRVHCFSYRKSSWELFMEEALFTEHSASLTTLSSPFGGLAVS